MTDAIAQHYATEAARLLADDTLAEAMTQVRMDALVALSTVDLVNNQSEALRLQAIATCLVDVKDRLTAFILAMGTKDGGHDPNKPSAE